MAGPLTVLEIPDGNPWYLSPYVWTVPGNNPLGAPGAPIVGMPTYVWASVFNNSEDLVPNAFVNFYWADPSTYFDRNSAHLIGQSAVFVAGNPTGGVRLPTTKGTDVFCTTAWFPTYVNGGHECIVAEVFDAAFHPNPPADPNFDVPNNNYAAQRNLAVITTGTRWFSFGFSARMQGHAGRQVLVARQASLRGIKALAARLDPGFRIPRRSGHVEGMRIVGESEPKDEEQRSRPTTERTASDVEVELVPGLSERRYWLTGRLEGGAALIEVVQQTDGRTVGGLALLVRRC